MKRGWITWDKSEIPSGAFDERARRVRFVLAERNLAALVVYSELWRSNAGRFFSNFMPYFNRALLIISQDAPPILLCGLSPRVYGWIRSVTTIEDVRPAGNFAKPLFEIASERRWARVGVLDLPQIPYDIYKNLQTGSIGVTDVESSAVLAPAEDETELAMRRKTAALAMRILDEEMPLGVGLVDHHFVGRLERRFRRAGAGDLVVLVTNGKTVPGPAAGALLEESYSVSIAVEYRGHWIRISRPNLPVIPAAMKQTALVERLDGAYPYEIGEGKIQARHFEQIVNGKRLFYGETNL
jgi:hypothetical protein